MPLPRVAAIALTRGYKNADLRSGICRSNKALQHSGLVTRADATKQGCAAGTAASEAVAHVANHAARRVPTSPDLSPTTAFVEADGTGVEATEKVPDFSAKCLELLNL